MSTISKVIDAIIRNGLAKTLKEESYKKKGRNFHSIRENCIRVVNVQSGPANLGCRGEFTLNFGVYLPFIAKFTGNEKKEILPRESECTVRKRIGDLFPKKQDFWWKIDEKSELEELSLEINKAWNNFGKPWINQSWDILDEARDFLVLEKMYQDAIVASLLLKDLDGAKRILREGFSFYQKIRQANMTRGIVEWAGKMGVTIN